MSEALVAAIYAIVDARIAQHNQAAAATPTPAATPAMASPAPTPAATPAAVSDPFGIGTAAGTAAPATAPIEVTPVMIQQLVMPLVSNEAAKARLQGVMAGMGITELPAARPDQLPALYAAFKAISDEFNGVAAAAAAAAAPAAAPAGGVTIL